jgi:hypothetical protein
MGCKSNDWHLIHESLFIARFGLNERALKSASNRVRFNHNPFGGEVVFFGKKCSDHRGDWKFTIERLPALPRRVNLWRGLHAVSLRGLMLLFLSYHCLEALTFFF